MFFSPDFFLKRVFKFVLQGHLRKLLKSEVGQGMCGEDNLVSTSCFADSSCKIDSCTVCPLWCSQPSLCVGRQRVTRLVIRVQTTSGFGVQICRASNSCTVTSVLLAAYALAHTRFTMAHTTTSQRFNGVLQTVPGCINGLPQTTCRVCTPSKGKCTRHISHQTAHKLRTRPGFGVSAASQSTFAAESLCMTG